MLAAKLVVLSPGDRTLALLSQYVFSLARYDTSYDVRDRAKMIASLLSGISPSVFPGYLEERSGVVLRREQVRLVLFEGKSGAVEDKIGNAGEQFRDSYIFCPSSITLEDENALLGSLSVVLGKPLQIDSLLPDWLEQGVESSLRNSEDDKAAEPVITAISSSSVGQRTKELVSPVVLTPTAGSRPGSRQDSSKGTFAQDLESFYADAVNSEEEESEEDDEDDEDEDEASEGDEEDAEEGEVGEGDVESTEESSESVEDEGEEDGGMEERRNSAQAVNSVIST
jgi:AP-3 complex subunit beta